MIYRSRLAKTSSRLIPRLLFFGGIPLVSLVITLTLLNLFMPTDNTSSSQPVTATAHEVKPMVETVAMPVKLSIPSLKIEAVVRPVGLTSNGDMDIGSNTDEVSWYQPGVRPGEKGSAVIAGHYGWKNGKGLVFNDVHDLKVGDKIVVYDINGTVQSFSVRSSRIYGPEDDTGAVFTSRDSKAHLNLITCGGAWDASRKMYSERLVVFADLETVDD